MKFSKSLLSIGLRAFYGFVTRSPLVPGLKYSSNFHFQAWNGQNNSDRDFNFLELDEIAEVDSLQKSTLIGITSFLGG
ncbi:MAG: hypothetical protein ACKO2V_16215 [Snowella sp.]